MIYLLALLSGVFHGVSNLLQKRAATNIDKPMLSSLIFGTTSTVVSLFIVLGEYLKGELKFSTSIDIWSLLLFSNIVLFTGAFWGQLKSMKELPLSEYTLLSRISVITYTLGGIFLLNEKISLLNLIGIILVLLGVITSGIRKGKFVFNKWVFIQVLASITFGFIVIIDGVIANSFSVGLYIFLAAFMGAIIPLLVSIKDGSLTKLKELPKSYLYSIGLSGAIAIIAYYLTIKAYSLGGLVSLTGALTQVKIVVAVVGGYIIFNERNDLLVKFIGVATVMSGLVLIKM